MDEAHHQPEQTQVLLDRMRAGDAAAGEALLNHACDRLRRLTRKMLRGFGRVKRWEQTDDVFQNALVRFWNALRDVRPQSAREFYGLAAVQIRRELIDLARQYYGPAGLGANQASNVAGGHSTTTPLAVSDRADTTQEPSRLAMWSEFHERVESLQPEHREVFDLLWYQDLTQVEAGRLLGISEATVKRRWLAARRRLHQMLKGEVPGS
jgi:RNA polymerase sigma-70 factor (ECF subfamily)